MMIATRRIFALIGAAALAATLTATAASAQTTQTPIKNKVVFQMSDNDQTRWMLALNNIRNVQLELGEDLVELELVAYGPGIGMLKGDSPVAKRIAEALKTGVKVVACENTMKGLKLAYADMLPDIGYAPSGVVELMRRQQDNYAYIRP